MKKLLTNRLLKNLIIYFVILVMFICCFFVVRSIVKKNNKDDNGINLYFIETTTYLMKPEIRDINGDTNYEIVSNVIKELKKGPKTEGFENVIPNNIQFNEIIIEKNLVNLDMSSKYKNLDAKEELIARVSIVKTLTGLDFIDFVKISVEGEEIKTTNGQPIGIMGENDVLIDAIIFPSPKNSETVKLYFANKDATEFNIEQRKIEVNPNEPLEKYIIEELIKGPIQEGNYATIPVETKLRNIKTETTDGICYVDLSNDFISKHSGGATGEWFTIYSIVNSLTELNSIKKVQFLIEGEKLQEFKGHIDFSKPFETDKKYGD